MPKLFTVSGYNVFFWSNEQGEPIHVHVSKGRPTSNATKIWLTKTGGCIVANNGSKIPEKELNELLDITTVVQPIEAIGKAAVQELIAQKEKAPGEQGEKREVLEASIVFRKSCRKAD